jgi:hypothetical protein
MYDRGKIRIHIMLRAATKQATNPFANMGVLSPCITILAAVDAFGCTD